jgi:WD40 repeat protein
MAIGCHPDEKTIVTCGVRNVTFWTMSKGHLQGREATGGGSKRQTMLCLAFTSDGMTVTGAQNGCIYLWKFAHLERTVVAHRGPLMDIAVSHDGLLTAGKDGLARLWDYDLTASVRIDAGELTHGMLAEGESSGGSCVRAVACILEESDLGDVAPSRRIAVGMSSNRIIQLIYPNRPHELDSMPDVRILAQVCIINSSYTSTQTSKETSTQSCREFSTYSLHAIECMLTSRLVCCRGTPAGGSHASRRTRQCRHSRLHRQMERFAYGTASPSSPSGPWLCPSRRAALPTRQMAWNCSLGWVIRRLLPSLLSRWRVTAAL